MRPEIIVIGAGGHAKVCIELLVAMGEQVAYCVGDVDSLNQCLTIPVLKGDEHLVHLHGQGYSKVFIAIGSNALRVRLAKQAMVLGYHLVNAISPHAIISRSVQLGRGIAIMAGAVINAEACIADLAIINTGATVDHDCWLERAVHIGPQCGLAGNVRVGEFSFLGIGCKIIPDVIIGARTIIGAGSVVIASIEDDVTAVGVPTRIIHNSTCS